MFPQRPAPPPPPPPPPGSDSSGKKDGFHPDFEESWLSKHAGKVGVAALVLTLSMITSYYKSYRSRTDFVEQLTASLLVEPHEINEARFGSVGMTSAAFLQIAQAAAAAATAVRPASGVTGQEQGREGEKQLELTYREFMHAIAGVLRGTRGGGAITIRAGMCRGAVSRGMHARCTCAF